MVCDRSVEDALQTVLKNALIHDGLARGLRESAKALDSRQAHLLVINEGVDEPAYLQLLESLASESKIPMIKVRPSLLPPRPPLLSLWKVHETEEMVQQVSDPKVLGQWAGLCKLDKEGVARKVVGCSAVVVRNYGVESEALNVLLDYFASR